MRLNHSLFLAFLGSALVAGACSSSEDPAPGSDDEMEGSGGEASNSGGSESGEGSGGDVSSGGNSGGGNASGGNSSGGNSSGGNSSGGSASGGESMGGESMGGMGGDEMATGGMPALTVVLDDVEGYNLGDDGVGGWSKWDPVTEVTNLQANSGTQSVGMWDVTGEGDIQEEAPELQKSYDMATEGRFQASIFIVPENTSSRAALFSIYGDSASSCCRLADFRFESSGSIKWRDGGSGSFTTLDGISFTPNTWVDIDIQWDSTVGDTGEAVIAVNGVPAAPVALYSASLSTVFAIKFGDNGGKDDTAALYIDDFGLATVPAMVP